MKRILATILTFGMGVAVVNVLNQAFSFDVDDVPSQISRLEPVELDASEPKFIAFFDSFGKTESFYGWFVADEFTGMDEVWAIQ
jgi:hypothetical protein